MILAAGRGTRLRPLTDYQPKALVKVAGVPLLELIIRRLKHFGCRDIVINVHHFGDQIIKFLQKKAYFGINIQISDEQDELLDTGGALKKAAAFFNDDQSFLLCNTDILSDINLREFYDAHCQSGAVATLAVQWRETSRYLMFDDELLLHGWTNVSTGEVKLARQAKALKMLAFSGIHAIHPRLFDHMPDEATFSIIDTYLQAAESDTVKAYRCDDQQWMDVGKPSNLAIAEPLAQQLLAKLVDA